MDKRYFMNIVRAFTLAALFFSPLSYAGWKPDPQFSIEGSDYMDTLRFVAGFSYALSYSKAYTAESAGDDGFFCLEPNQVTSKLIMDLANKRLSGDVTSEEFSIVVIEALAKKFPCR